MLFICRIKTLEKEKRKNKQKNTQKQRNKHIDYFFQSLKQHNKINELKHA